MKIAYLKEPHAAKTAFFQSIAGGAGIALATWPLSLRGFAQTRARAADCLARAKKQPRTGLGRAVKLAFLKGRYNWARRYFAAHPGHVALCWQGLTGTRRAFMLGARDGGAATLFAERAPFAGFHTLDPRGVNAEGSVPQDPAFFDDIDADAALLADLRRGLQARPSRRRDIAQIGGQTGGVAAEAPYLFVPLQVPDDSQITLFADWVGSVPGFIRALGVASHHLPEGWHLRIKEHPSAKVPVTDLIDAQIAGGARLVRDNQTDSFAQVAGSRGVVTINSSMGLQAMLFDKPVIATGRCFWALPGLALRAEGLDALQAAMAAPPGFDADLRGRFLTWLATRYYTRGDSDAWTADAVSDRIAGRF